MKIRKWKKADVGEDHGSILPKVGTVSRVVCAKTAAASVVSTERSFISILLDIFIRGAVIIFGRA